MVTLNLEQRFIFFPFGVMLNSFLRAATGQMGRVITFIVCLAREFLSTLPAYEPLDLQISCLTYKVALKG